MAIEQPLSTDKLNSPDHAKSHRIIAVDLDADVKTIVVNSSGSVGIGTEVITAKLEVNGSINNINGIRTVCANLGSAIWTMPYGENIPEHVNQTGSYDHAGGAYPNLFTRTAGDVFTQDDADNKNWILLFGVNQGAVAEIVEYIDGNNVIVNSMGWTGDLVSQSFFIMKAPGMVIGQGGRYKFTIKEFGAFEIESFDFTNTRMIEFINNIAADNVHTLHMHHKAGGYSGTIAQKFFLKTGALGAGESMTGISVAIDDTLAVGADATTIIPAFAAQTTNASSATQWAYNVLPGFDVAFKVFGATAIDLDYGYEIDVTGPTVVDRITGAEGDGQAFLSSSASDLEIFDDDNDYILIGSSATFEMIEVALVTGSSKDCDLEFYYSKAGDNWTPLVIESDGTDGFQQSGLIVFNAPGDWTKDDEAEVNEDITNAYYVKIVRTYAPVIAILPVEDYFKTFSAQSIGMEIKGDGVVKLPYIGTAPSNLENGMVWMESDGLHLYYAGAEKLVTGV